MSVKVSAGVETESSDWHFFLLTAENVLKQEGTGNVRESIKRAKKGVHIFSLRQALLFYKQRDNFKTMACQFIF